MEKKKIKDKIIDVNELDVVIEFQELIEELKTFDIFILYLILKNELNKRGYEK